MNHIHRSNSSSDDILPRKVRSLQDIYSSYNFVLLAVEPSSFEKAFEKEVWRQAMYEKFL